MTVRRHLFFWGCQLGRGRSRCPPSRKRRLVHPSRISAVSGPTLTFRASSRLRSGPARS
jgi:hypothetical protein